MTRIAGASGLPVGISRELRRFFDMSQDAKFVREHNERLMRAWDKTKPDHSQIVYALFEVVVPVDGVRRVHKPFAGQDSLALHHQFYFQADKEHEYWALTYLGLPVTASFYARHYIGDGSSWVFVEQKTISLSPPLNGPAANDVQPLSEK